MALTKLTTKSITGDTLEAGDDISEAKLFEINNLPNLAFDSHLELIELYKKLSH